MKQILEVADRPGWAVDRLSKPISEIYDNVDMSYMYVRESRFLASGYSEKKGNTLFDPANLEKKYDVIHFHYAKGAMVYVRRKELDGVRKIVTKHTERDEDINWDLFDDVICPTKYVKEQLENQGVKARLHYVPTGIDLNKYKCTFNQPHERTIGYVGRIIEHKRFDHILNAAVESKLRLISCGYVEDPFLTRRPRIKNKISQGKDFDFFTFLPENSMVDFYSKMQLFICGSQPHIETGPLPVLEAMACGVPVLSTEIGWIKDWGKPEHTYWKLEDSPERWAKTFKDVNNRDDIKIRLRNNALNLVQDFGIDKYAKNLMNIYNE